ncbi:hypothetical protein B7494_g8500 [Chlorociboria aeruginascens]|nr:hypothetical protein B7494_g8500 [Chlorociboria aeruginascens]
MNVASNKRLRGRPRKVDALPDIIEVGAEPEPTTAQVKIPTFTSSADISVFTEKDMPDKDTFAKEQPEEPNANESSQPIIEGVVEKPTDSQDVEMQDEPPANP